MSTFSDAIRVGAHRDACSDASHRSASKGHSQTFSSTCYLQVAICNLETNL